MTSSFLAEIASLNALQVLNGKCSPGFLLSTQSRFSKNNISHLQRLFRQYTNRRVLINALR